MIVLKDGKQGVREINRLVPARARLDFWSIVRIVDRSLRVFLQRQVTQAFWVAAAMAAVALLLDRAGVVDVKYPLAIAMIIGAFELIPEIGPIIVYILLLISGLSQGPAVAVTYLGSYFLVRRFVGQFVEARVATHVKEPHAAVVALLAIMLSQVGLVSLGLLDLDNPSDGQPGVRVMISEVPWTDMRGQKIPILAGIAGTMAVTAQAVAVPDYNAWENRLMPERIAPFQAAAGVPLKLAGRMIGTLVVMDDKPERVFTPGDITILEMMAPQAAIVIRNAQLFQELEERIQAQQSTESRLVRAARMAAVGEMAGSVAHELNNPLTSVIMFIELTLKQLAVESKMHQNMSQALNEALRCRSVIQRLLNVSRDTRPISETHDQIGIDR